MKRIHRATPVVLALWALVLAPAGPAAADQPKPPMVSSSSVPGVSNELANLIVDAQQNIKIEALFVTTRKKTGRLTNPTKAATKVTYSYKGKERTLKGWDAVHFLVTRGYFKWEKGVGLLPTEEWWEFGPGATQATLESPDATGDTGGGSTTAGSADSGTPRGTGSTPAAGGGGQGAAAGGGGGQSASSGGDSTKPRAGGSTTGEAAEFTCDVDLKAHTLWGSAAETNTREDCIGKVAAKREKCINDAKGDSSREAICHSACDRTIREKCNELGSGIPLQNSSGK